MSLNSLNNTHLESLVWPIFAEQFIISCIEFSDRDNCVLLDARLVLDLPAVLCFIQT